MGGRLLGSLRMERNPKRRRRLRQQKMQMELTEPTMTLMMRVPAMKARAAKDEPRRRTMTLMMQVPATKEKAAKEEPRRRTEMPVGTMWTTLVLARVARM